MKEKIDKDTLNEQAVKIAEKVGVKDRKNYLRLIKIYLRELNYDEKATVRLIERTLNKLGGKVPVVELDELDLKILKELQDNSRLSYTELKEKFGVVDTTIRKRIKRLEEKGVIERYTVALNPEALGFNITAFIGIDTEPNLTDYVAEKLCELDGVREVSLSTGPHDIMIDAVARDIKEFGELVEKIRNLDGITKTHANIAVKWFKKKGSLSLPL